APGLAAVRFARTRWRHRWSDRAALLTWQERRLRAFLRDRVPRAPFYGRPGSRLEELPIVDKQPHNAPLHALNTRGLRRDEAMAIALAAERSRDFRPELGDLTIGLS